MHTETCPSRLIAVIAAGSLLLTQTLPRPAFGQGAPPPPAGAQDQQQGGDPPARVGRLARISGTVSFHTQDETQWNPATLNYPVTAGDAFWADANARADIEVSASRVVLAPTTELDIADLTDTAFQATEPQGEVYLHLETAAPGETYAVQTPRGLVTLSLPGRYEVASGDTDNPTRVTVIEGSAQVSGPGVSLSVAAQQAATISGTDTFQGQVGPAQPDAFLTAMLNSERPPPQAQAQAAAPPAVAAMPGAEDLATYGSWSSSPDYGQVWYPQVSSGWAPYREGSWAYVAPWGWTWVDNEPWGFAPFHYGRWAMVGGRWGWVPGISASVSVAPVYAPALVTFFGVGAAVGIGIGAALTAGNIGWCPLGPREVYQPWYHASPTYFRNVNVAHVTNLTNITTVNRNVTINNFVNRGAATVVPTSAMVGSRPIAQVARPVTPQVLAQARPVVGEDPVHPGATTLGVTPAVARRFNLQAPERPAATGPAIHPIQAAAGVAPATRPAMPSLHNPADRATPAAAGTRPITGTPEREQPHAGPTPAGAGVTPALREPLPPGHVGPPPVQHEPAGVTPGAIARPPEPHPVQRQPELQRQPAVVTPGAIAQPTQPHPAGPVAPAVVPHPAPPVAQPRPPEPAHPQEEHRQPPPAAAIRPVQPAPVVQAAPPPQAHPAPQPMVHAAPPAAPAAPPVVHTAAPPPPPPHPVPEAAHPPPPHPAGNEQHKKPGEQ